MNLVREFYQSLATPEEKEAFYWASRMSDVGRERYLRGLFGVRMTDDLIREFTGASRDDLLAIADHALQVAVKETRKGILASLKYVLSFKWLR